MCNKLKSPAFQYGQPNGNTSSSSSNNKDIKYSLPFLEWWKIYPHKINYQKPKCFSVWKQKKLDKKADEIIAKTLHRKKIDKDWKTSRFIPYPLRYLEDDIWTLEMTDKKEFKIPKIVDKKDIGEHNKINQDACSHKNCETTKWNENLSWKTCPDCGLQWKV